MQRTISTMFLLGSGLLSLVILSFAAGATPVPAQWQTQAEASDYRRTSRYDEDVAFARRLAAASPYIDFQPVGKSPEGRALPVIVVSKDRAFSPEAARATGKEIVLVIAGIHPGEIPGKDAGWALVRDMAITATQQALLDKAILIFIPIFNVDGHERFGPYNRINQNGPEQAGWRTTAQNYNLNRDFLKADSPEMRTWLDLFHRWQPDLIVDTHDTDGADFQYDLTYGLEFAANLPQALVAWQKAAFLGAIFPATERHGHKIAPYIVLRDSKDPTKGFDQQASEPRYSTGYGAILNRPSLLVETHMLKDYRTRVLATYDLLVEIFAYLNRHPGELRALVNQADSQTTARGQKYDPAARFPLTFELSDKHERFAFKGFESHLELSALSGTTWIRYDSSKPRTFDVPYYSELLPKKTVAPPLAYIVPVHLSEVIERIKLHHLRYEVLTAPRQFTVQTYRLSDPVWEAQPFENHIRLKDFKLAPIERQITYPTGSLFVPLDQPAANVAIHLLEPEGPDSLLQWGYLDALFEQKEYAEPYVMEKKARELIEADPQLKAEFEQKLSSDPAFAASPEARLDFFYRRTPYWDERLGIYPIGRIIQPVR